MKIDINQLTQDKKKLGIIVGLTVGLVCVGGVVFMMRGSGGGDSTNALGPRAARRAAGGGAPAMGNDTGAGPSAPEAPAAGGPGGPGGSAPSNGPAPAGNSAAAAPAGSPASKPEQGGAPAGKPAAVAAVDPTAGDGTQILPGPPVEPFRADPFRPVSRPRAPQPRPVYPPVVAVLEPPTPLVIANPVNVVPAGAGKGGREMITTEPPRRLSGVLWDGLVVAVLESQDPQKGRQSFIVRPGDSIPGQNVRVKAILRDKMILVPEDPASGDREIVVDLKPASNRPMGMGPGMPGSGSPE